jgi:hypothetical protein
MIEYEFNEDGEFKMKDDEDDLKYEEIEDE